MAHSARRLSPPCVVATRAPRVVGRRLPPCPHSVASQGLPRLGSRTWYLGAFSDFAGRFRVRRRSRLYAGPFGRPKETACARITYPLRAASVGFTLIWAVENAVEKVRGPRFSRSPGLRTEGAMCDAKTFALRRTTHRCLQLSSAPPTVVRERRVIDPAPAAATIRREAGLMWLAAERTDCREAADAEQHEHHQCHRESPVRAEDFYRQPNRDLRGVSRRAISPATRPPRVYHATVSN
jgi:hypothetical protein